MSFEGELRKGSMVNFSVEKSEVGLGEGKLVEGDKGKFVERFWGGYVCIEEGRDYQVKRLRISPGKRISLQKHLHRSEHWVVVSGVARVVLDDDEIVLRKGESTYVGLGAVHRLENIGKIDLEIIEVQLGEYLGEDDIERFADDFGRVDLKSEEFCIGPDC